MTWFDGGRWCVWDLETSSPLPLEARLVTACVAFVGGGEPTEVMSWVVDAGVDVPAEAAEIHGYTTERVRAEGKPIADVLPEIVGYLAGAVAAGMPLVAYNAAYDNSVLNAETLRLGLAPFGDVLASAVIYDPLTIDKHVDRYRPGKRTLTAACEHYGVKLDGAHDSTFDALAAARVLYKLGQRSQMPAADLRRLYADRRYPDKLVRGFQALGQLSPRDLYAEQVVWYRESAEGLAAHWRRQAGEKLAEADRAVDEYGPNDEGAATVRGEAEELLARADSVSVSWPIQAVPS